MDPVDAATGTGPLLAVIVVFSPGPDRVIEAELQVAVGATVGEALAASGLALRHPDLALGTWPCGVWGRPCSHGTLLRDQDRVELYRPLRVDPKEARRRRHLTQRQQRSKALQGA